MEAFLSSKTDLLDARDAAVSSSSPILRAVNIPLAELADRSAELPAKGDSLRIADTGPEGREAAAWLEGSGRVASLENGFVRGTNEGYPLRLWSPNQLLLEALPSLRPGLAIDLGCGSGREALALAACGWNVIAVDRLPDALERARELAGRFPTSGAVDWVCADLDRCGFEFPAGLKLASMFFFLDRSLISQAIRSLASEGTLLVEAFTSVHQDRFGKPRGAQAVVYPNELVGLAEGLRVLHYSEEWRSSGRHTARLWAAAVT